MRLLIALLLVLLSQAGRAAPELILINGRILTVDEQFTQVQAIAIRAGKIIAIGRSRAVLALADEHTRVRDLQGRTVIPGLIDNHMHLIRAARSWRNQVRFDGITDYDQALAEIAAKARELPPGEWITAFGGFIERQFLNQPAGFRLADLDRMAPDHPVYLQHLFDWGYANSLALRAIGIDPARPASPRAGLLPDAQGLPSGAVTLQTQQAILAALPAPTPEQRLQGASALIAALNAVGLTAVLDAGGFGVLPQDYRPFQQLDAQAQLNLRLHYLLQLIPWERGEDQPPEMARLERFRPFNGTPYFQPIGVGEQLYLRVQDSAARAANSSPAVQESFLRYARELARRGIHLHLHAVHDQSIRQHLAAFERISREYDLAPLRWTLAHADGISADSIRWAQRLGINIAVHSRPWLIGHRFHHRFADQAWEMTPMAALTAAGVPWGLGSDSLMVSSFNPFHTLGWAVTGTMVTGQRISHQNVGRAQALIAHTRHNARLLFAEHLIGSLEPGKRADLVVLDRDYLAIPADEIRHIRPLATMLEGRWVYLDRARAGTLSGD